MKLQRYDMGDYCSGYVPIDDGDVCMSYDVERLEASNLEMSGLIKQFIDYCDNAPAMECLSKIASLVEPMRNVLNNMEGKK